MFDWAVVGNPGNAGDVQPQGTFGAVGYTYNISKYEVTNAQYTEFLNSVDSTGVDALGLYSSHMGDFGGIEKTGTTDGQRYVTKVGRENNPVTFVSWYDGARFTNWLHNGQGSGDTETGAYTLLGGTPVPSNGNSIGRNPGATYFLPSEDEWYKAAYHNVTAGTAGTYFDYPTGTDVAPYSDNPNSLNSPDNANVGNFYEDDGIANGYNGGHAVSGTPASPPNPFTDVGAYTEATSPYGTYDQGGGVMEWNETLINSSFRGLRDSSWGNDLSLSAAERSIDFPWSESSDVGFRVASIPEPSTLLLVAMGSLNSALP